MVEPPEFSCACGCGKTYRELREDFPLVFEVAASPNPWNLPEGKRFMGRLAPEPASDERTGDFVFLGHWPAFFHGKRYCGNLAEGYAQLVPPPPTERPSDEPASK